MGVSTDAILVYGIPLEKGAIGEHENDGPEEGPAWMVWSGDPVDGIEIVSHCSGDYPMHIVAIAGSEVRAWRGNPIRLERDLATVEAHDALILAFLKRHGLKRKKGATPGWWLASMWS